jgi:hypothetical protein
MAAPFSYLNSPCTDPPAPSDGRDITQEEEDVVIRDWVATTAGARGVDGEEQFDEDAEAGEYVFPNLEQDLAIPTVAERARMRGEQRRLEERRQDENNTPRQATATPPLPNQNLDTHAKEAPPLPRRVNFDVASPAAQRNTSETVTAVDEADSALIATSTGDKSIKTAEDLYEFLDWQAIWKGNQSEQAKFKEDAFNFPGLLVFAVMRPKSHHIQLLHSLQVYPNAPGSDPAWKGKTIGFLGDRTRGSPAL